MPSLRRNVTAPWSILDSKTCKCKLTGRHEGFPSQCAVSIIVNVGSTGQMKRDSCERNMLLLGIEGIGQHSSDWLVLAFTVDRLTSCLRRVSGHVALESPVSLGAQPIQYPVAALRQILGKFSSPKVL